MNKTRSLDALTWHRWALCSFAVLVAAAAMPAMGADDARARFEKERARCLSGQSHQAPSTCLREARAAYAEARQGRLGNNQQAAYERNATQRCERLPSADRTDCLHRMQGHGTVTGSVEGGGIYRETVTVNIGERGEGAAGSGTSAAPGTPQTSGPSGLAPSTSTPVAPVNTLGTSPGSVTAPMPPAQPPAQPVQ